MNGGRNYNGPKVENAALVKFDYLLESLANPPVLGQGSADIGSDMTSDNPRGVHRVAMSQTISRKGRRAKALRNPQRPYVERPGVFGR